jgi:hypothetical protein
MGRTPHTGSQKSKKDTKQTHRTKISGPRAINTSIPSLLIGPHDLSAIEAGVRTYLAFLRKSVPTTAEQQTQIRVLRGIQARLLTLLTQGLQSTAHLPLTLEELVALKGAMIGFGALVQQNIPLSPQREGVLKALERFDHDLGGLLSSSMEKGN